MGTITERKLADGSKRFLARVGVKKRANGSTARTQTFESKRDATLWLAEREVRMAKPGFLERVHPTDLPRHSSSMSSPPREKGLAAHRNRCSAQSRPILLPC
jgi:hypothetical protein